MNNQDLSNTIETTTQLNTDKVLLPKFILNDIEVLGRQCADTGKCHHQCEKSCFRKESCSPLSVAKDWLNDDWSLKV